MTTTWDKVVAWAAETIEAIEPTMNPHQRFHALDGFVEMGNEPLPTFDRSFVIAAGKASPGPTYGMREERDVICELFVSIGYVDALDRVALERRIGIDRDLITAALEHRDGSPAVDVQWVDADVNRSPLPEEPERQLSEIRFAVKYRVKL